MEEKPDTWKSIQKDPYLMQSYHDMITNQEPADLLRREALRTQYFMRLQKHMRAQKEKKLPYIQTKMKAKVYFKNGLYYYRDHQIEYCITCFDMCKECGMFFERVHPFGGYKGGKVAILKIMKRVEMITKSSQGHFYLHQDCMDKYSKKYPFIIDPNTLDQTSLAGMIRTIRKKGADEPLMRLSQSGYLPHVILIILIMLALLVPSFLKLIGK